MRDELRKLKPRRAIGPNLIPVKIQKCTSEEGLEWLTRPFGVIFKTVKMPSKWRTSKSISL